MDMMPRNSQPCPLLHLFLNYIASSFNWACNKQLEMCLFKKQSCHVTVPSQRLYFSQMVALFLTPIVVQLSFKNKPISPQGTYSSPTCHICVYIASHMDRKILLLKWIYNLSI